MFVPEFSHIRESAGLAFFVTSEGVVGAGYSLPVIDLEGFDLACKLSALQRIARGLPTDVLMRVTTNFSSENALWFESPRAETISKCGYLRQQVLITFESRPHFFPWFNKEKNRIERLAQAIPKGDLLALGASPCSLQQLNALFLSPQTEVEKQRSHLDFGDCVTGVVRLYKQGTGCMSEETLSTLLNDVPLPFSITTSIKKVSNSVTEFRLRSQLARQAVSQDPTDSKRLEETTAALDKTALEGAEQFCIEWLLTLQRPSESELRTDLAKVLSALAPMGQLMIETTGCVPSFRATLPGADQHFTFLEYDQASILFLPVFTFGETAQNEPPTKKTLVLHRQDGSLHLFDQFSRNFLAYNAIISGKTGSGKSVLANALSNALLADPDVHMVKIDVGGSYKKECELFGGTEIKFSLDRPSGINPFRFLSASSASNDVIDTLTKWLCTLIREENENNLPRTLSVEVGKQIKDYTLSKPTSPSIDDFMASSPDFPRKSLLARWCRGGVFENAFSKADSASQGNYLGRYLYFNFESIQNAGNPDFSEGVMAAVIAEINLEMFRLGHAEESGKRLVLFCDETKFFIERNAQFFLLTTANFRKFGHGVILITQNTQTFDLASSNDRVDSSIVLNSPIRFFLEQDVERDYLKDKFALSDRHIQAIIENPYRGRDYREFVLQDDTGTRILRLYLTAEEYWRVTSTRDDNEKLALLRKNVPGLTLQEAITCLSH